MTLIQFQCKHQFATGFQLDIEFESSHGVTALFGQSGSGKTSVLNIIAGVILSGLLRLFLYVLNISIIILIIIFNVYNFYYRYRYKDLMMTHTKMCRKFIIKSSIHLPLHTDVEQNK